MRIIVQSELYPPILSGESVFAHALAQGLADRGHEVLVVCASPNGPPTRLEDALPSREGVQERSGGVSVLALRSIPNPGYATFRLAPWPFRAVAQAVRRFRPEAVQLNNPGPSAWALLTAARRRGVRVVSTHHFLPTTLGQNRHRLGRAARLAEWLLWRPILAVHARADRVTAPSRFARDTLRRAGLRAPVEVVSNGVDTARFHPVRADRRRLAALGVPAGARVVLSVGRLYPSKRVDLLLAALVELPSDVWLLVVGDGPARSDLERQARAGSRARPRARARVQAGARAGATTALSLSGRVVIAGAVPDDDLPALFASADAFAIASTEELQGIVVLEALASGTPVVAARAGALPELVRPGVTGEIFSPGDRHGLAQGLRRVLAAPASYSRDARLAAEDHDHARTVDRFERLLGGLGAEGEPAGDPVGDPTRG